MKRIFCFFLFFAVYSIVVQAQSADETAVANLVTKLDKAIVSTDTNTLKQITSKSLSYGHSSGKIQTQQQFVIDVSKGPLFFQSIDISDQTISIVGTEAIVRHTFFGKMTVDGKPGEITIRILMVWHKDKKGNWTLLARQGYKI